jgi:hypothetical protein
LDKNGAAITYGNGSAVGKWFAAHFEKEVVAIHGRILFHDLLVKSIDDIIDNGCSVCINDAT